MNLHRLRTPEQPIDKILPDLNPEDTRPFFYSLLLYPPPPQRIARLAHRPNHRLADCPIFHLQKNGQGLPMVRPRGPLAFGRIGHRGAPPQGVPQPRPTPSPLFSPGRSLNPGGAIPCPTYGSVSGPYTWFHPSNLLSQNRPFVTKYPSVPKWQEASIRML